MLALLAALFLPAPRAEVPLPLQPGCGQPDRPDLCPPDLDEWWLLSYVPAGARDTVREAELDVGSGCHADSAWGTTTGRWDVVVAVLDSGIDWSSDDIARKVHLNVGELPPPQRADGSEVEGYDLDGNGLVNISDYAEDPRVDRDAGADVADGWLDASDLIHTAWGPEWDGIDNDGNGYADDIAGWDFSAHDNDPYNDYEREDYGTHGTGVMENIAAEGGDWDDIGVCPSCSLLPVRVGHAFISDAARVAQALVFAVDSGASVVNLSIGALSHSAQVDQALAWARDHGVAIAAAAGDENAYHTNYPAVAPDLLYAHSIRADNLDEENGAYSYQSFLNCNNYGARSDIAATGRGCATSATAMTSGAAGLVQSAARDRGLALTSAEIRQLVLGSADDIWLSADEQALAGSYPSSEGWDPFYGWGKLNAARAVERVALEAIPPQIELTSPPWFDYLDVADAGEVEGRIAARAGAFDYTVEVGMGWEPTAWTTIGSGHAGEPVEGLLASLDLSDLPNAVVAPVPEAPLDETILERAARVHAPLVTVRVTALDEAGGRAEARRAFFVQDDPDLLDGFPVHLGSSCEGGPVLADLDGDGALEIVVATSGGEVHALGPDGELPGYPLRTAPPPEMPDYAGSAAYLAGAVDPEAGDGFIAAPAVGDLTGDGRAEVVGATMAGGLYAWRDGQLLPGFPVWTIGREPEEFDGDDVWDRGFWAAPVLYDLDGDGTLEILAAAMDGRLYAVDHEGRDWGPYPVEVCHPENCGEHGAPLVGSPAVGDVDGDGDPDVALGSNETVDDGRFSVTFLLDARTGEALPGWPRTTQGLVGQASLIPIVGEGHPSSVALADLDGDGDLEIADSVFLAHTALLHHDGTEYAEVAHFQDEYGADASTTEPSMVHFCEQPAFGDLTGDGVPDLVQGATGTMFLVALPLTIAKDFQLPVAAWDGRDGGFLPGWPRQIEDLQFFMAPAIADLTGDGRPEAVLGSGGHLVHAWDADGIEPDGWPKLVGQWLIGSPAVGDVDGDGYLDAVVATRAGEVFAWATRGHADEKVEWGSIHHDAMNTGNYGTPLPVQAGPPGSGLCDCCCASASPRGLWLLAPLGLLLGRRRRRALSA